MLFQSNTIKVMIISCVIIITNTNLVCSVNELEAIAQPIMLKTQQPYCSCPRPLQRHHDSETLSTAQVLSLIDKLMRNRLIG